MDRFNIYWDDLTAETQAKLYHFLGNNNGNYDIIPIVTIDAPDLSEFGVDTGSQFIQ